MTRPCGRFAQRPNLPQGRVTFRDLAYPHSTPVVRGFVQRPNLPQGRVIPSGMAYLSQIQAVHPGRYDTSSAAKPPTSTCHTFREVSVTLQAVHPAVRGCAQRPTLPQGRVIPSGMAYLSHYRQYIPWLEGVLSGQTSH